MANLGANFYPKLVEMTSEVGLKPEDLLAIMVSESGINPSAGKGDRSASGLIQFMPFILPGVGFSGTPDQFRSLSGEQQLPYIQKYIADKVKYNGGPFKSAAQYYVANFWPVALKLPGVKEENPSTPIVEEHPATITDRTGHRYSKKYYDLGIKITPEAEAEAYKDNPLFHGSIPGAITYGDMMKQVEKNRRSPMYRQALLSMQQSTGYTPTTRPGEMMATYKTNISPINQTLEKYLRMVAASEKPNKKLYKKLLPNHNILIQINAGEYTNSIEFARILCSALDTELLARAFTHVDGSNVEVECDINGPKEKCFAAVNQLTDAIVEAFKVATDKIGGIKVSTKCIMDKKSSYQQLSLKTADSNYRKFLLKFI